MRDAARAEATEVLIQFSSFGRKMESVTSE